MASLLEKRAALRCFSIALILSAALDALSTIYACHFAGSWEVEANPVFRGLGQATSGAVKPVLLLIAMKVATVAGLILWLRSTLSRLPDLYPALGRQLSFFQFANFLFSGVEARGWRSLFLVPPLRRLCRGLCYALSVPVSVTVILAMLSASIVNTFHLLDGLSAVIIFWAAVSVVGEFAGLELLRRDFFALSRNHTRQPGGRNDWPPSSDTA